MVDVDLNPGMLEVASALPPREAPIGWVQASAVRMPFPDRSFGDRVAPIAVHLLRGRIP